MELPTKGNDPVLGQLWQFGAGIVAGLLLLTIGYFLGFLQAKNLMYAFGLLFCVFIGVAAGCYIATRFALQHVTSVSTTALEATQKRVFEYVITAPPLSGTTPGTQEAALVVITLHDVINIERNASEIWSFGTDLAWDYEPSNFANVSVKTWRKDDATDTLL